MTTCFVAGSFTSKGSLENLSALSLLDVDTSFELIRTKSDSSSPHVIQAIVPDAGSFKLKGDFVLNEDGHIDWTDSRASSFYYRDFNNKSKNFRVTDSLLQTLPSFILLDDVDPLNHAFNNGYEYRGTKRDDRIDISNLVAENLVFPPSLAGGRGADTIIGSDGSDFLSASTSRDICDFGSGTDLSKRVKDVLIGGDGIDTFYVDNGTKVTDVEIGETLHLYNHLSNDLRDLVDKTPIIKNRPTKTVIKVGHIRVITNPVEFEYSYGFTNSVFEFCITDQNGIDCSVGMIPGQPEGYRFTAI